MSKIEYVELTQEEFKQRISDYESELKDLFAEGDKLKEEILSGLKKVKYDI